MIKQNVAWVCHDCGVAHGKWYKDGKYVGPPNHYATMHYDTCDVCGKHNVICTEPRDYGYLVASGN